MSIYNTNVLNQYTKTQMTNSQVATQPKSTSTTSTKNASTTKSSTQTSKQIHYSDISGRLASMPELEKYEDLIKRFISGESEMESADKPLTEDQIALRGLMREYMRTDKRSASQISMDMKQANKNFMNYWFSNGNKGPMPGRIVSADGSFTIFNSKAEKDEYMKSQKMDFLKNILSVINAKKEGIDNKKKSFDITI